MGRFIEGADRGQTTLFPECLEDWICEDNPVRVIDVFVDWPAPGSKDTELGVLMEPEVGHGETAVYAGVQA